MKKYVLLMIAVAVCVGLVSSCVTSKEQTKTCAPTKCPAMGKAGMSIDQCPIMSKLNLSDAQKVDVQKIREECVASKCTKKSCAKMKKSLGKVLTPEQMAQFNTACDEMKGKGGCCKKSDKSGCPMKAKKSGCSMKQSDKPAAESK